MGGSQRQVRKARPTLEGLEGRRLLSAKAGASAVKSVSDDDLRAMILARQNGLSADNRTLNYTTAEGTKVQVKLYGQGTLAGTQVDAATGALELVFDGTNANTKIVGHTQGGTGRATVATVQSVAAATAASTSTVGSTPINVLNLRHFDFVEGGAINLLGGVNDIYLGSIAQNTQIHALAIGTTATETTTTGGTAALVGVGSAVAVSPTTGLTGAIATNTGTAVTTTNGTNAATTQTTNAGSAATTGSTTSIAGTGTSTNGVASTSTSGITSGGTVSGTTVAVTGTTTTTTSVPTGVLIDVQGPVGGAHFGSPVLGDPQVFGYDAVVNRLLRFDTTTGAVTLSIALPTADGVPMAGVGLGRDGTTQVALVGIGTEVYAYNAVTGASVGQFSTTNLAGLGLAAIDGIGSTDAITVLSDSAAGATGEIVGIDVTRSLAAGAAVPITSIFSPNREFTLGGGATGISGSSVLFALGSGHFDTAQPDRTQLGVIDFSRNTKTSFLETARLAVFNNIASPTTNVAPRSIETDALGSVDGYLAVDSGVSGGKNVVTLYPPTTLVAAQVLTLNDPNRLSGLSESFHPEILDAALIDVQGNLKQFLASSVQGAVINSNGTINIVAVRGQATDLEVIGRPLNHAAIPRRQNVTLLSAAARGNSGVATRNGVEVTRTLRQVGPLTLP